MRNPYVTGSYVTESKHYGRAALLDYLLHGQAHASWVVGNRRIGKTSLLRQLEVSALAEGRQLPLYWDLQGSGTYASLGCYLADAVREHWNEFAALGLPAGALDEGDVASLLAALRRVATRAGRELLLLCDETEVLIGIARAEPGPLQRLHRELTAGAGLRVVATSTQAIYSLHDVCRDWPTSPFLAGFDMSQTLGRLSAPDACALVTQSQEPREVRVEPDVVDSIIEHADNHPYLIQLLCVRLFQEDGSLRSMSADDLQVDQALAGFFAIDYRALTDADRGLIEVVHSEQLLDEAGLAQRVGGNLADVHRRVYNLEKLGFLRRIYGQVAIGNSFLASWLSSTHAVGNEGPIQLTDAAMQVALTSRRAQENTFLVRRLNADRTRLVELEMTRARDLLEVSPQVLSEVEQLQGQVRHVRRLLDELEQA